VDARSRLVTELLKLLPDLMRAMQSQREVPPCPEEAEASLPPEAVHAWRHLPHPTHTQIRLAIELAQEGPATIGDLAQRLGVTAPAVSLLVDRMAEHGLIERARDAHDRRVVWVRLTPPAQAFADAFLGVKRRLMANFLERLPESEREAFVRNVALFARVLGPASEPAPEPAAPPAGGATEQEEQGGAGRAPRYELQSGAGPQADPASGARGADESAPAAG